MLFLRTGSSTPVALVIAVSAAFLNISISAFLGTVYRFKNHVDSGQRAKGHWALVGALLFIIALNTGVAAARLIIAQDFSPKSVNSVFLIESTILFVVGIVFGLVAFWKGYRLDDKYPGYGPVYSAWQDAEHELAEAQEELQRRADGTVSQKEYHLTSQYENLESADKAMDSGVDELRTNASAWRSYYESLAQTYKSLISAYRGIARAVLGNSGRPIPLYFESELELPKNDLLDKVEEEIRRIDASAAARKALKRENQKKIIDARSAILSWRVNKYPQLLKSLLG